MSTTERDEAERLHRSESHPGYEYETTTSPRKAGDSVRPEGEGWEPNPRVAWPGGWRPWDRFEYHEEEYWRRPLPSPSAP